MNQGSTCTIKPICHIKFLIFIFAYSESKLTFHFVVVVVVLVVVLVVLVLVRRKVEKDGNAKKGPLY